MTTEPNAIARAILTALGVSEHNVTALEFTSEAGEPEYITVTYMPGPAPFITQRFKITPVELEDL